MIWLNALRFGSFGLNAPNGVKTSRGPRPRRQKLNALPWSLVYWIASTAAPTLRTAFARYVNAVVYLRNLTSRTSVRSSTNSCLLPLDANIWPNDRTARVLSGSSSRQSQACRLAVFMAAVLVGRHQTLTS